MTVNLPEAVRAGIETVLSERAGAAVRVSRADPLAGGCVSQATRVETETGVVAFLKWGTVEASGAETGAGLPGALGIFTSEAESLRALAEAGGVRVPEVFGVAPADHAGTRDRVPVETQDGLIAGHDRPTIGDLDVGWILLEWLEPGPPTAESWRRLGQGLARLHRTRAERYGWSSENHIGPLPQSNGWLGSWPAFWRERRLLPQLERAVDGGYFSRTADRRRFGHLLDRLDEFLGGAEEDGASLLHGDLWGGNVHVLADGSPALIDPSSYYGHREVDLAMSELFGGFAPEFYRAYDEGWPLRQGYGPVRRAVYQLYYLLVHVNLFGAGYVGRTLAALTEVGV